MNSLRNLFGGGPQMGGPFGNMFNWFGQLQKFAQNPVGAIMSMGNVKVPQNFNGTPEQLVNYLVNSGQMSQQQFQQFSETANQMQNMINMGPNSFRS